MNGKRVSMQSLRGIRWLAYAIVLGSILLLQACSSMKKQFQKDFYGDYSIEPLGVEAEFTHENVKRCTPGATTSLTDAQRQDCILLRSVKTTKWIALSDEKCESHKKTIFGNEASYNIILGTLTNISAGLGTIFADPALKTIFSAGALFSNSTRSLINETVYKTMIVSAIVDKITDERERTKATIVANLKDTNLAYERYPINAAFVDVSSYHYQCSFMYGLQKALKEGTQNTTAQRISELKNNLNELELQMKSRAGELHKELKDPDLEKDPIFAQRKSRYDTLSKELTKLQSSSPQGTTSSAPASDTTPPSVTSFEIPSTSHSLKVPISKFEATDDVGVTGYMATESATAPSASATEWSEKPPTEYSFKAFGKKTLYPWAKDGKGNISILSPLKKDVEITSPSDRSWNNGRVNEECLFTFDTKLWEGGKTW